ncbi:ROK family transcriptional regulator [Agrobacterium rhizogenes]|uniref:ROK family transcriptional regulator n=1 Tax=Rhizobium rhizogenes TaxID=359 RepID=UPI0004D7EBBD|nr:ROK family transcriptional regulator [Rhizobium rhizogenes]KAA6476760.1 ROK family transcriptional regulator [Agrobacterium sp. ICMP 7243]OCJ04868.1 transcriptional regulator [Agrobacterium sp. 13-626]OCJ23588.1 transcriptional regulator [Agrobacterium sp. B131/95]OCJ28968.1 transcriptional regulator [Agrobacterium sp. B133/95]KEA03185.1 transcriptional regulator [Rhizobium rhizogenes]
MDISTSIPHTRQATSRAVLRAIFETAPVSRAELARLTGLSKQSMSEIVRDLETEGWLRVTGRTQGSVGRSAVTYELEPRKAFVFGADVGGTKIHAALAGLTGDIIEEAIEGTDARGGEHVIEQIARMHQALLQKSGIAAKSVAMGAIGIPGAIHPKTRRLAMVPNIPGLTELTLEDSLRNRLGHDILIDNDVNLAALGEQWRGDGRSIDNFVFVALGTGIGMGIINEGRLIRGARGAAGEISTLPIGADPFDSRSFAAGALESSIGSVAIRGRYEALGGTPGLSVRDMFEREDDPVAAIVIDEVARLVATSLVAIAAVVDPERVIFGGSVGARPELVERIIFYLSRCVPVPLSCTISPLGSKAGLIGAIAAALDRFRATLFEIPGRGEHGKGSITEKTP